MKVLILGGSGMLGHKLYQVCAERFDTYSTFRQSENSYAKFELFDPSRVIGNVAADDVASVATALAKVQPSVVVNCIGVVKQDAAAKDPLTSISINALFPHRLAQVCHAANTRLVHLSTDCVFSGRKGNYTEDDLSDAEDLYGKTKYLGEVGGTNCLTLRTSMIGRELHGSHGLLEWFLNQQGKTVRGFRRAVFSGFTTRALAETIAWIIADHPSLEGVLHLAAEPISKFDLLTLVKEAAGLNVQIEPDETFVCDRSLNGSRLREATGFVPPGWSDMISQLFLDSTPYNEFRRSDC
ncbi:MAG: dTDP-4-dehydrorhamnose reductase [Acidobacteriota bacterium]|jgi:dTDP-4-dehydrorhamnose reductase|nr:dTDP-4-dehydrorhamnose reductase [Acidobacteriota bacterium]